MKKEMECPERNNKPLSEFPEEEEEVVKATSHGSDDDKGSQEEVPTWQCRKRGSGKSQSSNLKSKHRHQ